MSNQQIAIRGAKWTTTASAINTGISLLQLAPFKALPVYSTAPMDGRLLSLGLP